VRADLGLLRLGDYLLRDPLHDVGGRVPLDLNLFSVGLDLVLGEEDPAAAAAGGYKERVGDRDKGDV
jgi:hypothetical protein